MTNFPLKRKFYIFSLKTLHIIFFFKAICHIKATFEILFVVEYQDVYEFSPEFIDFQPSQNLYHQPNGKFYSND